MQTAKALRSKLKREVTGPHSVNLSRTSIGVRFLAYVRAMALEIKGVRNSEKTKLRLMAAALELLDRVGFRELNIDEVVKVAGLAKGTFYIHFPSKDDFLIELAKHYLEFELVTMPIQAPADTPFARLRDWIVWYERTFQLNIGVIRCIVQMSEVSAEMRDLWHRRNGTIVDRIIATWYSLEDAANPELARLALRLTGGMLDQSLFERHKIQIGPGRQEPNDPELLNELHALLLYRALYGRNPPEGELKLTRELLAWPN
jgi:AcrR family transcriptional regulator